MYGGELKELSCEERAPDAECGDGELQCVQAARQPRIV